MALMKRQGKQKIVPSLLTTHAITRMEQYWCGSCDSNY